jgi:hypothetical protein
MQNPNFELAMNHSHHSTNPAAQSMTFFGPDGGDLFGPPPAAECAYQNAASCPDCGGGMVRLGVCFSCPSCGFESCSV